MKTQKDHEFKIVPVRLTNVMVKEMSDKSKNIKGCSRPNEGSISYFVFVACIEYLKKYNINLNNVDKIYSCYK